MPLVERSSASFRPDHPVVRVTQRFSGVILSIAVIMPSLVITISQVSSDQQWEMQRTASGLSGTGRRNVRSRTD